MVSEDFVDFPMKTDTFAAGIDSYLRLFTLATSGTPGSAKLSIACRSEALVRPVTVSYSSCVIDLCERFFWRMRFKKFPL